MDSLENYFRLVGQQNNNPKFQGQQNNNPKFQGQHILK